MFRLLRAGQKLVEAKPNFALIISPSDRAFIKACAPTLTLEEFNVFKAAIPTHLST